MKSSRNIHRPYTVEIEADAWGQVSQMPRDTYRAVQSRLESLARLASQATPASAGDALEEPPSLRVGELVLHYAVDPRRRLIRLLRISRERSTASAASRPEGQESSG